MSNKILINVFFILFSILNYSCVAKKGVKKLEKEVKSILESKRDTFDDIDGDLINNDKEIELGLNPNIPNIPKLSIHNVQRTIFYLKLKKNNETKDVEIISSIKHNDDLRELLNRLSEEWFISVFNKIHYEQLLSSKSSVNLESFLQIGEVAIVPLQKKAFFEYSDMLDDGWKIISGSVRTEIQLKGSAVLNVTTLDKISISMGTTSKHNEYKEISQFGSLYNSSGTPLVFYNKKNEDDATFDNSIEIHSNTLDAALLDSILRSRINLAISVIDFRFQRLDTLSRFSELTRSVNSKNSKIIIKDNDKIETFFTLKNKTIKEFFKSASLSMSHDAVFNLTGLNGKESSLKLPLSSNDIENQSLDNGNWKILNGEIALNSNVSDFNNLVFSYLDIREIKKINEGQLSHPVESFHSKDVIKLKTNPNTALLVTLNLSKNENFIETGANSISKDEEVCTRGKPRSGSGRRGNDDGGDRDTEFCEVKNYRCQVEWKILNTRATSNLPLEVQSLDIQKSGAGFFDLNNGDVFKGNNGRVKILFSSDNLFLDDLLTISIINPVARFPVIIGNRFIEKSQKLGNCGSPLNYDEKQSEAVISHFLNGEVLSINKNAYFDLVD